MMKRMLAILAALALFATPLCVSAEETAGAPEYYTRAWLCNPAYGYDTDVTVLVVTNDPARGQMTPEEVAAEIRYIPFDEAAGVYASGEGEPAGERAELRSLSGTCTRYDVRLNTPGKYLLSGAEYYLFDSAVPVQAGLRAELDRAVTDCRKDKDAKTAKALHDWICGRVSPVFPEGEEERLAAVCADPMNALLTGYACDDAYSRLNGILLNAAGIRCLTVRGTAGEKEAAWNLFRQDGEWRWTDIAADAAGGKKGAKYLALDDKGIGADHTLCAADEAFTAEMIRLPAADALLSGKVDLTQLKIYEAWDRNLDLLTSDGPAWVVGDSATVTFRLTSNRPEMYREMTPEAFLEENMTYMPWIAEEHYYYNDAAVVSEEMRRQPEIPPLSELVTVEAAAEDLSSFTLTFHVPGAYMFFEYFSTAFYLISPDQEEPAKIAADMDAVVAKAKGAATEKQAAQILYKWIGGKVKYNTPAWHWTDHKVTARDMQTSGEPIGALLYGKCTCGGYSMIYAILMQQAGILQFPISGVILPGYDGHAWNINRLDGEWTETDATWSRFAWTREKMSRDRELLHNELLRSVFYQSAFDLLADQAAEDRQSLRLLPTALKYLPRTAEGYGFPEISEKDIPRAELIPVTANSLQVKTNKAARIRVSYWEEGEGIRAGTSKESGKGVKEFTTTLLPQAPLIVEILTYDNLPKMRKPALCGVLYFRDGEPAGTGCRYMIPVKKNEYPGNDEYSYRYYEFDGQMRPWIACWHLGIENGYILEVKVYFDAEGKAERYTVSYDKLKWEGTPDQPLTKLRNVDVPDPAKADSACWEAIRFE